MKSLVLGLGNPILGDDGVGLGVVALVRAQLGPDPAVEIDEACCGGLRLMERLAGYDQAILVDAIHTGEFPAGAVLRLSADDIATQHSASVHDVNLATALQLGEMMGLKMPGDIRIIAVEAQNTLDFSEQYSPAVAAAVPQAVAAVIAEMNAREEPT
jgi:hydrogenase maturation protease